MTDKHRGGIVTLTALRDGGGQSIHKLGAEQSVLIGTSPNCGFRLEGDGLSACHCLISLEQGSLWVQDWASKQGTVVNGQAITAKTSLASGDQLRVGTYSITVTCEAETLTAQPPSPVATKPVQPTPTTDEDPVVRFDGSQPTNKACMDVTDAADPFFSGPDSHQCRPSSDAWFAGESFEQETIQLLKAEIEELQGVVAQRDAQLAELTSAARPCEVADASGDPGDALLARMDQLLGEAAGSDERVAVLEEMLLTAEQAHQAEQEERQHLEAWVDDIERRIGQRDEQRNAEMEAIRTRLKACEADRDRAQRQLQQAAGQGSAAKCYEETLERLQQQNHELQEKLATALTERRSLVERLDSGETQHDQSLREERAAIAQERALVSRMRSELTTKLAAFEDMPERAEQPDREVAIRLRTLREHLREIHLQEQQQQQSESLSSRIARLWKRVEP